MQFTAIFRDQAFIQAVEKRVYLSVLGNQLHVELEMVHQKLAEFIPAQV